MAYKSTAGKLTRSAVPWEQAAGSALERTAGAGKRVLRFRETLAVEGDSTELHVRSMQIAKMGRSAMSLVPSQTAHLSDTTMRDSDADSDDPDWNTEHWTTEEIHASLETLIQDVERSNQKKRRRVATSMVVKLLSKHQAARDHMELLLMGLADKALLHLHGKHRSAQSIRLAHFLSAIAPMLPSKLSRLGAASKSVRLLTFRPQLAARMLQVMWRAHRFERKLARLQPINVRLRQRAMNILALNDLKRSWERLQRDGIGLLSPNETLSQLRLLVALTTDGVSPNVGKDRRTALKGGVLSSALSLCTHASQDLRQAASSLLLNLVREPALRLEMLRGGTHTWLVHLLRSDLLDDRRRALDILDLLLEATSANAEDDAAAERVWCELERATVLLEKTGLYEDDCKSKSSEDKPETPTIPVSDFFVEAEDNHLKPVAIGLDVMPNKEQIEAKNQHSAVESTLQQGESIESKLPRYMRDRNPAYQLRDAAELVCAPGKDGGVLRWLRQLLASDDPLVRLGCCMVLCKTAAGPCNYAVLGLHLAPAFGDCGSERTAQAASTEIQGAGVTVASEFAMPPPLAASMERHIWRVRRLIVSIVECLSWPDIPALPVAALQLFYQLSATKRGRSILETAGAPELLLPLCMRTAAKAQAAVLAQDAAQGLEINQDTQLSTARKEEMILLVRGLHTLVALSSNMDRPWSLCDGSIAGLELDATPADLTDLLHERLLLLITKSSPEEVRSSLNRLAKYGAAAPIISFLLASAAEADGTWAPPFQRPVLEIREGQPIVLQPEVSTELPPFADKERERDHCSVASLIMGRFCEMPSFTAMLCKPRVFFYLARLLHHSRTNREYDEDNGVTTGKIERAAVNATCCALSALARCPPSLGPIGARGDVAAVLAETGALSHLVYYCKLGVDVTDLNSSSQQSKLRELDLKAAVNAVSLLGTVAPWLGFERDAVSDMMEIAGSQSIGERVIDSRACLPPAQKRTLGRLVAQTAQPLLSALNHAQSSALCSALCYTLARFACTRRFAASLLGLGAVEVALKMIPPPPRLLQVRTNASCNTDKREGRRCPDTTVAVDDARQSAHRDMERKLRTLPATLFTLLASLSRVNEVRRRIWRSGLLSRALERLLLPPLPGDANSLEWSERKRNDNAKSLGEVALLLARLANTHVPEWGSANEQIVRAGAIDVLLKLVHVGCSSVGKVDSEIKDTTVSRIEQNDMNKSSLTSSWMLRVQHNALLALAQLSEDPLLVVPPLVNAGAVGQVITHVANENALTAHWAPLTRQALRVLFAVAKYPLKRYHKALLAANVVPILQRIGGDYQLELRDRNNKSGQPGMGELARSVLSELRQTLKVFEGVEETIDNELQRSTSSATGCYIPGVNSEFRPSTAGLRDIQEDQAFNGIIQISPWRGEDTEPLFQSGFKLGSRGTSRSRSPAVGIKRRRRQRRNLRTQGRLNALIRTSHEERPSTTPLKLNTNSADSHATSLAASTSMLVEPSSQHGYRRLTLGAHAKDWQRPASSSQSSTNIVRGESRLISDDRLNLDRPHTVGFSFNTRSSKGLAVGSHTTPSSPPIPLNTLSADLLGTRPPGPNPARAFPLNRCGSHRSHNRQEERRQLQSGAVAPQLKQGLLQLLPPTDTPANVQISSGKKEKGGVGSGCCRPSTVPTRPLRPLTGHAAANNDDFFGPNERPFLLDPTFVPPRAQQPTLRAQSPMLPVVNASSTTTTNLKSEPHRSTRTTSGRQRRRKSRLVNGSREKQVVSSSKSILFGEHYVEVLGMG